MSSATSEAKASAGAQSGKPAFAFPEYFHFPPFFTLQPVQETREKQLAIWTELVMGWCNHHKVKTLTVGDPALNPLFRNATIDRQLDGEGVKAVLDAVQAAKYGQWEDDARSRFSISPVSYAMLASAIYAYAERYNLIDNVATVEELSAGDETSGEIFHGLSPTLIEGALKSLEAGGRAVLVPGDSASELGVKFLKT